MTSNVNIKNKKATYEYQIIDKLVAGLQLTGTEIKSVRLSKASIGDGYCAFRKGELWVKNLHIAEYERGTHYNHEPMRPRKLLLTKRELNKLEKKVKEKGLTVVPLRLFISERGFAKLEIALAKGKKAYDKRETIKKRDVERDIDRRIK